MSSLALNPLKKQKNDLMEDFIKKYQKYKI